MIRGLTTWVVLLGVACPAGAQDMVFTMEDTGQVAPSPGVGAAPSEALANALRLYQRERYAESAVQFQRVVAGGTTDSPANLDKAQFFMAKGLYHLRFYRAALSLFDEITQRGEAHQFFEQSLPWLAQLATQLPAPAGIIDLVGRYSPERIETLNTEDTREVYDHLSFLFGRHAYNQGELETAVERFGRVREGSPHRARALFFQGVTHVRLRRASPAIHSFRAVLDAIERGGVPEAGRMRALAWMSLGRTYYTAANRTDPGTGERIIDGRLLGNAVAAWDEVDSSSEYWLDALFEQSWALFLGNEESRAMGNIHALFSPYFEDAYYPEAVVLKAVAFFGACQNENTTAMIGQFHQRYDPVAAELAREVARHEDNEQFYRFLLSVRAGQAQLSERIRAPVASALSDRTIVRHLDYVRLLDEEQERLTEGPEAFRASDLGDRIAQDILVSRSFAVDRTGDLVRGRFERMIDELDELMTQMDTVEVELLRTIRDGLGSEATDVAPPSAGLNVEVDEEHQRWPFNGEYWRDELPFYRQQVTHQCTR